MDRIRLIQTPLCAGAAALLLVIGCSETADEVSPEIVRTSTAVSSSDSTEIAATPDAKAETTDKSTPDTPTTIDAEITSVQQRLLDLAFDAASAIPTDPHIKDQAKAQQAVALTALELDRPNASLTLANGIDNWRRGYCYAEYAVHLAQKGTLSSEEAEDILERATVIALRTDDWRRDRILATVAQAHTWLGDGEAAAALEASLRDQGEMGKVDRARSLTIDDETFDAHIAQLDRGLASGSFDHARNAMQAYIELLDRYYENATRRATLATRIRESWNPLPIDIRVDLLMQLAEVSLGHNDKPESLRIVNEAEDLIAAHSWTAQHHVPMRGRLVGLRYRAGDIGRAMSDAEAVMTLFESSKPAIYNIYRSQALRPMAESYLAMGEMDKAAALYASIVEYGVENPNSRPRALDLSATSLSMAINGFVPSDELWARMQQIRQDFASPW